MHKSKNAMTLPRNSIRTKLYITLGACWLSVAGCAAETAEEPAVAAGPVTMTDVNGVTTTTMTDVNGVVTTTMTDTAGNVTTSQATTDTAGNTVTTMTDAAGNVTTAQSMVDAAGNTVTTMTDAAGNVTTSQAMTDAAGNTTVVTTDANGAMTTMVVPAGTGGAATTAAGGTGGAATTATTAGGGTGGATTTAVAGAAGAAGAATTSTAGTAAAAATLTGEGLDIGGICIALCTATDADDDGDGCGFQEDTDCIMADAELAVGAAACTTTGEPPTAGDGFMIGCSCQRSCDDDSTDANDDGETDGYGWEYGASCVVGTHEDIVGKTACVPPAMATGEGYLVRDDDEAMVAHCVPACGSPDLVENEDGWGWEHQQKCIVEGSVAEGQVSRCEVIENPYPFEPGDGYYLLDEDSDTTGTCHPGCSDSADEGDEEGDGFGFEQDRTCIFTDSTVAKIDAVPCVPPPSTVTGECPDLTCPTAGGSTLECGCTWVEGYATRKAVIVAAIEAGGSQSYDRYFLASAMMETNNLVADYTYGDVFPDGRQKTGDAFNAGLAKQNWGMMKQCHSAWNGGGDYNTAGVINDDVELDVVVYNECRSMFGDNWWSGHRNGANNLGQSSTDIDIFKAAMDWTNEMLQEGAGHYDDDVYFWVDVTAI